jgi:hypothetical protein
MRESGHGIMLGRSTTPIQQIYLPSRSIQYTAYSVVRGSLGRYRHLTREGVRGTVARHLEGAQVLVDEGGVEAVGARIQSALCIVRPEKARAEPERADRAEEKVRPGFA